MSLRDGVVAIGFGLLLGGRSSGYAAPAVVRINELDANVAGGCDLVELLVSASGSMDGFQLWERTSHILTFSGLNVQAGDFVMVHLNSSTCAASCTDETGTTSGSSCAADFSTGADP